MTRLAYTDGFLVDLSELDELVENAIWEKLALVESMPGVGSAVMEPSLCKRFGIGCLKIAAMGYDVLYERHDEDDTAVILGVINQKRVR